MIIKQPNLINFTAFKSLDLFDSKVRISKAGIIHDQRLTCDVCGTPCHYNGSSNKGRHGLSKSTNSFLRKGQQYCPTCNRTMQVENEWLDNIMESVNQYLVSQIISLSENLSEDEIVRHFETTISLKISKSNVHNVIKNVNEKLKNMEFEYEVIDEFYAYDEQYLGVNGKRAYRLVIFDLKNNKIIYEKIYERFSKKILVQVLREVFGDTKPKGFVVDMRLEYPSAFQSVFGKKIKVQLCIFHLNKLILKEYGDCLKVGKSAKWTLVHQIYLYNLFNIFYDREFEINILKSMQYNYFNFKKNLTPEKINYFVKKYGLAKKDEKKLREKIEEIEQRKLLKIFRKIVHDKKNERKRNKQTLKVRNIESAKKIFDGVYLRKSIYPYKIQRRIIKIKDKFNYFTASEGEVLTTNKLEGLFGATLKKFKKKSSKCFLSLTSLLKRKIARQEGIEFYKKFTIFEIATIFTAIVLFV